MGHLLMRQFSGGNIGHKGVAAARFAVAVCLGLVVLANVAKSESRLISQEQLLRLGLKRAWFTQVRLDRARNHVERAVLEGNQLTVLTTAGVVQEIDAQTGETLWFAPIGNENYPSLGPIVQRAICGAASMVRRCTCSTAKMVGRCSFARLAGAGSCAGVGDEVCVCSARQRTC